MRVLEKDVVIRRIADDCDDFSSYKKHVEGIVDGMNAGKFLYGAFLEEGESRNGFEPDFDERDVKELRKWIKDELSLEQLPIKVIGEKILFIVEELYFGTIYGIVIPLK